MKILQLCLRVPFPPKDGGAIAMHNLTMGMSKAGAEIKVAGLNTKKHFVEVESLPAWYAREFEPEFIFLDASVRPVKALLNIFGNKSYNISRFDVKQFHKLLKRLLTTSDFQFVVLESLFMSPYLNTIRENSSARIVLRSHNIEYRIWQRLSSGNDSFLKRWYFGHLAGRLKAYEKEKMNSYDGIITLTREDSEAFKKLGCEVPVMEAPIGLDLSRYVIKKQPEACQHAFHLGSMDWFPNIEAVDWFLKEVYQELEFSAGEQLIHFAGKEMPQRLLERNDDHIRFSGEVKDAAGFMKDKQIMIVPLLSGGGMRVKIIEGLALGKTIISTSIGAEGIDYHDGKNMIIADSPKEFAKAIMHCFNDSGYTWSVGNEARILAEKKYDDAQIGEKVVNFLNSLYQ